MNFDAMNSSGLLQYRSEFGNYLGLAEKFSDFIIVAAQPFTQRNLDRFGATWLSHHGKRVHLVDLSLVIWGRAVVEADQHDATGGVLRPRSWQEVESFFRQFGKCGLLIPYVTAQVAMPFITMIMQQSPIPTLFYECGARMPASRSFFKWMASRLKSMISDPRGLMRSAGKKLALVGSSVDYLVMTCGDCEIRPHHCAQKSRLSIASHAYDYVTWQSATSFIRPEPYIVFLDQAYPDHPDFAKLLGANPFSRETYYSAIEGFLCHVSDRYGMPIIVALHPRSQKTSDPKPYQGFETFRDATASLVKGAHLVVAHDTTAVSFAVLGRKPLLLVEVQERSRRLHIGNVTRNMSIILGSPVVPLSSCVLPSLRMFVVDEPKYASYEALYLRHPACNGIPVWDRVFGISPSRLSSPMQAPENGKSAKHPIGQNRMQRSQ